jgi:hypothetical protein
MSGGFDRSSDSFDIIGYSGAGLDLDRKDRLDRAVLVVAEPPFDVGWLHGAAPVAAQNLDADTHPLGGFSPVEPEPAARQHQNPVTFAQDVGEGRFPRAVTVGDIDVGLPCGAEQALKVPQ